MNLYAHTPFCASKCAYCALPSAAMAAGDIPADFPELLAKEFSMRWPGGRFSTVYFGGGTPSMLGAGGLARLGLALRRAGLETIRGAEWTVELNPAPGLIGGGVLGALADMGANRLSFGVQSLDDGVLAMAGRRHTAAEAVAAVSAARAAGFANIGIDLIAGLPGDDECKWRATLAKAADMGLKHMSVYALTVEPGTALARMAAGGGWTPCADGELLDRLSIAEETLAGAGFRRYEISNYAAEGFECRHNLACWRGEDYLGIGPGAASRIALARRANSADWRAWREGLLAGRTPPADNEEELQPADDAEERFIFGLRMAEGVSPDAFARLHPTAAPLAGRWRKALAGLAANGIAAETAPGRWALTPRGREVADSAIEALL